MHRSILLLAPLALAACSSPPSDGNVAATPTPYASIAPDATAASTPPVDTHTPPKLGELKTFGDWAVGCDNLKDCEMASLGPEGVDFPPVNLMLAHTAGPEGAITVTLLPNGSLAPEAAPTGIAIDDKTVGGAFGSGDTPALTGDAARQIAAAMSNGRSLAIRDAGGKTLSTLSLKGASAALRYIDAQQGRAGSVTAIVAKGNQPAASVPSRPAAPQIAALTPSGEPFTPTAAMIATMKQRAQCDDSAHGDVETHALGGGATLILLPCSAGAYNLIWAVFVAKDGKATPAQMDAPSGFTPDDQPAAVPMLVNSTFADATLTSFAEGRGLGDCGSRQEFVWDGSRFRLSHQEDMGECRGDPNYITTWSATVLRH
jgi:hypothetical protein